MLNHIRTESSADEKLGYTKAYNELNQNQRSSLAEVVPPTLSGIEQSEEILQWIWNHFAAVGGDMPAFERWRRIQVVYRNYIWILTIDSNISETLETARSVAFWLGHADRRAFRSRNPFCALQRDRQMVVLPHERSLQRSWRCC